MDVCFPGWKAYPCYRSEIPLSALSLRCRSRPIALKNSVSVGGRANLQNISPSERPSMDGVCQKTIRENEVPNFRSCFRMAEFFNTIGPVQTLLRRAAIGPFEPVMDISQSVAHSEGLARRETKRLHAPSQLKEQWMRQASTRSTTEKASRRRNHRPHCRVNVRCRPWEKCQAVSALPGAAPKKVLRLGRRGLSEL